MKPGQPSTVEDVRAVAAATELARCLHRMRCAAFALPDTEWGGLTSGQKDLFVEHAYALLMRLKPLLVPQRPMLKIVPPVDAEPEGCIYCGCAIDVSGHEPYCSSLCAVSAENS